MRIGILGFPRSGKTTLFNVLARAHAPTGTFASAAGGIHVGTVQVPDARLEALRDLFEPKKYTPARIEYVDLAGPPSGKDASGALLPPQITSTEMLLVVVRAFEDASVHHPKGSVDPIRDATAFEEELVIKDMTILEGRLDRVRKAKRVGQKGVDEELALLDRCLAHLGSGRPLREIGFGEGEEKTLRGFGLLTARPALVVFNVGEDRAVGAGLANAWGERPNAAAVEICGKVEMEIAELPEREAAEYMQLLGIVESGLTRVIRSSYELLGVQSFFTVGSDEVRAWTVPAGTSAVRAAGAIHSDLERGFIRAEVVSCADLLAAGGLSEAKGRNLLRVEGKDYPVRDGDVLNIRFSV